MNSELNIVFIGCGNIAKAMVKGIVKSKIMPCKNICIYDRHYEKTAELSAEMNVSAAKELGEVLHALKKADFVFVCVKPDALKKAADQIKDSIKEGAVIVSPAAGVSVEKLNEYFESSNTVRIMPNIAISVMRGITMICENESIDVEKMDSLKKVISSFGDIWVGNEKHVDAFTALAGSSPAMIFMLIEAMADAAVYLGIKRSDAYNIAAKAVEGSAGMLIESQSHPAVLRDGVCSPSGTTIEMCAVLENESFRSAVMKAIIACADKCKKLG